MSIGAAALLHKQIAGGAAMRWKNVIGPTAATGDDTLKCKTSKFYGV